MYISDWISDVCSSDLAGTIQVCGPGQVARTSSRRLRGRASQSARPSSCATDAAIRIRPLSTGRCLIASRRWTVASLKGSQLKPQTASVGQAMRSEEHTSELQSLIRISYAVYCFKKTKTRY